MSACCSLGTVHGTSERSARTYFLFMFVSMCVRLSLDVEEGDDHSNGDDDECDETDRNKEATTNEGCHFQWTVQVLVVDVAIGV